MLSVWGMLIITIFVQICDASAIENNGKLHHIVYFLFGCTQSKCGREHSAWKAYSFPVANLMNGQPGISSESSNTSQVEVKEVKSKVSENNIARDKKHLQPSSQQNSSTWDVDCNWGTTDQSNDSLNFEITNWSVSDEAQKSVPDDNASSENPSDTTVTTSAGQKLKTLIPDHNTLGHSSKSAFPRQSKNKAKIHKQRNFLNQIDESKPSTWIADSSDDEHDLFSSKKEDNSGEGYSDLLSQLDTALDINCNDTTQKRASNITTDDDARYVLWKIA